MLQLDLGYHRHFDRAFQQRCLLSKVKTDEEAHAGHSFYFKV